MNNIKEKLNNLSSNNNNIQKYFKKNSNSDISIEISKDSKTHYMDNEMIYENNNLKKRINNLNKNLQDIDNSSSSNKFSNCNYKEENDLIKKNDGENYFNQFKNDENFDGNFLNNQKVLIQKKSQSVNKIQIIDKSLANSDNNLTQKSRLIRDNKNPSNNFSHNTNFNSKDCINNSQKSFSFLKKESFDNNNNNLIKTNNDEKSSNNSMNNNINLKSTKEIPSLDKFSNQHININAINSHNQNFEIKNNDKNSYSFLSSEIINEHQGTKKFNEYNSNDVNELINQYMYNYNELEEHKFKNINIIQRGKNEMLVNTLNDMSSDNKNLILNKTNCYIDNLLININNNNENTRNKQNNNQMNNVSKNQNLSNQDFNINNNYNYNYNQNLNLNKMKHADFSGENLINNYYFNENSINENNFCKNQNPLKYNIGT